MINVNELNFATNLGVLYGIKEKHGYKTLQETYGLLENISYNRANNCNLDSNSFAILLDEKEIGFVILTGIFQRVIEAIMFNGMSEEEIAAQKNLVKNLK